MGMTVQRQIVAHIYCDSDTCSESSQHFMNLPISADEATAEAKARFEDDGWQIAGLMTTCPRCVTAARVTQEDDDADIAERHRRRELFMRLRATGRQLSAIMNAKGLGVTFTDTPKRRFANYYATQGKAGRKEPLITEAIFQELVDKFGLKPEAAT